MATLTVDEILKATGGKLLSENSKTFHGVSTDSRTIQEGEIFCAIRGEKFDGSDFLENALERGSGAIVDKRPETLPEGKVIICVNDTLRSLQDLAHFLRIRRDIPLVAVTGSNGKTTTKEMIYLILSGKFKVLKNEGNLNNHIGLPISLTYLEPDDEVIVLEMGMNAAGEIRRLCEIAVPSHGIITNIGSAHIGKLGSNEAVRAAKFEMLGGLRVAVVNADDAFLMQGLEQVKDFDGEIITFAINNEAHITARDVRITETGTEFILGIKDERSIPVVLNVHGHFNVYNALAAGAVSYSLGMSVHEIKTALQSYRAFPMRFEVIKKGGITIINDSYNANPSSVRESVRELIRVREQGRVVAMLGDMHELGGFSEEEHRDVGRMIAGAGVDIFVAVGQEMSMAAEEMSKASGEQTVPEVYAFRDSIKAKENVMGILKRGDTVLIKGSRSMTMEKIIEGITNDV